jgi:hypothetical protein
VTPEEEEVTAAAERVLGELAVLTDRARRIAALRGERGLGLRTIERLTAVAAEAEEAAAELRLAVRSPGDPATWRVEEPSLRRLS